MSGYGNLADELARLGKHRLGKSCLYINKLADIRIDVLESIIEIGLTHIRARYPTFDG